MSKGMATGCCFTLVALGAFTLSACQPEIAPITVSPTVQPDILPSAPPGPESQLKTFFASAHETPYPSPPAPLPSYLNPIATPLPTSTPLPVARCNYCKTYWSEIEKPVWAGDTLVYFQINHEQHPSSSSIGSKSQLYRTKSNQSPEKLNYSYPYHSWWMDLWAASDRKILYLTHNIQAPNLAWLPLDSSTPEIPYIHEMVNTLALNQDRSELVWTSSEYGHSHKNQHLKTSSLSDFQTKFVGNIVSNGVQNLSWLPDNQGWAWIEVNPEQPLKAQILKFDTQENQSVWLTFTAISPAGQKVISFKFSPDNKFLAVVIDSLKFAQTEQVAFQQGDLWIGTSDGQNMRRVLGIERVNKDFDWSPDSQKLVIASGIGKPERSMSQDLFVIDAEGASSLRLTDSSKQPEWWYNNPRWSPDGQLISFVSNRHPDFKLNLKQPTSLYLIQPDGYKMTALNLGTYTTEQLQKPPAPDRSLVHGF